MDWIRATQNAIEYIERNIAEALTVEKIASEVNISPFYFQKGFSMLCGYTVGEYIRMRRLSLAGGELLSSDIKVIDLAMKYGYDSPDSFTKAFARFHGNTPMEIRRNGGSLKSFAPLYLKLSLEGGTVMEYRIEERAAFKVAGVSKVFSYEEANTEIPRYWDTIHERSEANYIKGMYGICFDAEMAGDHFRYVIGDDFLAEESRHKDLEKYEIPAHTWAIFPCKGPMPVSLQEVNRRIFSEWLPASRYEIAEGYNIEYYSDAANFKNGTQDSEYYTEVWIPVKEKDN